MTHGLPIRLPPGTTLEASDGLWVGRCGSFFIVAVSLTWVLRELWRESRKAHPPERILA